MRLYLHKTVSRALTPTGGFLRGFAFSLNPYIGCAFGDNRGCPFCYVRALPVAHATEGGWGTWVIAKINLAERLARELELLARTSKLERTAIFMSSATDPYQGIERRLRITRGALAAFAERPPHRILLQTHPARRTRSVHKNTLITRVRRSSISTVIRSFCLIHITSSFPRPSPAPAYFAICGRSIHKHLD
jgi:DNA repair photolyase